MKRRNFFMAAIAVLAFPFKARAATIDEWSLTPGPVPGSSGIVPPTTPIEAAGIVRPSMPVATCKKVLQWAAMCLRQGPHWSFEGINAFVASLPFKRNHLCRVHGHRHSEVDGLSSEQLIALHDAHHEGRAYGNFPIPPTPRNGVNRMPQYIMETLPQSNCPNGHCPAPQRFFRRS